MKVGPLKIGFLGGSIHSAVGMTHKIALSMDGLWTLAAGCFSRNQTINRQTASLWGVTSDRVYATWKDMLRREKNLLDAVAVITPTPDHADMVVAALNEGYSVVCDKSLATSSSDTKQIMETLKKTKGFLAVTYNYSGYPMIRELQWMIQSGTLGKLQQVHIEMPQEGFLRRLKGNKIPKPQSWRLKDYEISTLSLDLGVHVHHLIHFLTQERPTEVVCLNNNFGFFKGIVDNTLCLARYTGNLHVQMWFGKTALGSSNGLRIRVYGSKGSAQWLQMDPEFISLSDNRGRTTRMERCSVGIRIADQKRYNRFKAGHPAGFIEAFANYYVDVANHLRNVRAGKVDASPWVFGVDVAHQGLVMLETMAKSSERKSWVTVESE